MLPIGGNAVASAKWIHCRYAARADVPGGGASRPLPWRSMMYSTMAPDSNIFTSPSSMAGNLPNGVRCAKGPDAGDTKSTTSSRYGVPSSSRSQWMRTERVLIRDGKIRRTHFVARFYSYPELRDELARSGFENVRPGVEPNLENRLVVVADRPAS